MAGYGAVYLLGVKQGREQFTVAANPAFVWLQMFAVFYPFSALLDAGIALELLSDSEIGNSQLLPFAVVVVFGLSSALVFGAMGQRPLFDWLRELTAANARPAVADDVLDKLADRIQSAITENNFYGDSDLSLILFSKRISAPPRLVSQSINRRLGMSFSDLLNCARVNAAKELLADPKRHDQSIVDIAYEVGYRSKSNFNRIFKQETGLTPSEYRARPNCQ